VAERLEAIAGLAGRASAAGASLLVLPEMSVTGYDLVRGMAAEEIPGPISDALTAIARDADLFVVAGMTEQCGRDRFNVLSLVGPDGPLGCYRKLHVSAVENAFWQCGLGAQVIDCDLGRLGLGICADMLFASPWRSYVDQVDLVVIGAAWPDHRQTEPFPYGSDFCETHVDATADVPLHLSRVLGVPVVLANAAGTFEARLPPLGSSLRGTFAGRSCIVDGEIIARAGVGEELLVGEVGAERHVPRGVLEPWLPQWSRRFRLAARGGDVALGWVYRAFYEAG